MSCHELDIAPSTYYWHQQRRRYPGRLGNKDKHDVHLKQEIQRVFDENYAAYG